MLAQLVSLDGGSSILLDKPILLIGRDPECDIQIDSRKISRRHCCIAQVNDYLVVRDLGSTNGIRVNGMRVQEGNLKASDELMIGGSRFRVSWEVSPEAAGRQKIAENHLEPAGDQPFAADEDLLLEACDEPVALGEQGRPAPVKSARPPSAVRPEPKETRQDSKTPREIVAPDALKQFAADDHTVPPMLPDSISLAPSSDSEMKLSPRAKK